MEKITISERFSNMMKCRRKLSALVALALFSTMASLSPVAAEAPPDIPLNGFTAELHKNWNEAARNYRWQLHKEPYNVKLWLRLRDVERAAGNTEQVVSAMEGAVLARPDDPALRYQLMQLYSEQNQPQKALAQAEKALELVPDNIAYLMAHAALANWAKQPETAEKSYARVLDIDPNYREAELNLARSMKWGGNTDRAVKAYDRYCGKYPDDKIALNEYILTQGERGNYHGALKLSNQYRREFGEDEPYRVTRATILAWADRPDAALGLTGPLTEENPDNFDAVYAQTLALHYANRPREALAGVDELARIRPESMVTENTRTFVNLPLRSNVWASFDWYHDSDSIDLYQSRLQGELQLRPETKILAGAKYNYQKADAGSGLEAINDKGWYGHRVFYAGIDHRFLPSLAVDATAGYAATDDKDTFAYTLGADFRFSDSWRARLERWYDFSLRSPRTTSLGIKEGVNTLQVTWTPDLVFTIDGTGRYGDLSDENTFWDAQLAPRAGILRSQRLNLEIGPVAYLLSYQDDLGNGYYDPDFYQKYMIRLYGYWKINDNNGVSFTAAWGEHKDDQMNSFHSTQDLSLQGYFGIYKDLFVKVRAGTSHNLRESNNAYDAYFLGATVNYRF